MKSSLNKFSTFLFSDPWGKIFSFMIACVLWYYVNIYSIERTYISLPITLINEPTDKVLEYRKDIAVKVEIMAREDVSRRIEKLQAVIDLSNISLGSERYPITLSNLPQDIRASISPSYLNISAYEIVSKKVPIYVQVVANNTLTNTTYSPREVTVFGSSKILEALRAINTLEINPPIPLNNILKTNVQLSIPRGITVDGSTMVAIRLDYKTVLKTNDVLLPITILGLDPRFQIESIPTIPLQLVSPNANIERDIIQSEVILDLSLVTSPQLYLAPATLKTPSNVSILNLPSNVSINILENIDTTIERETTPPSENMGEILETSVATNSGDPKDV